MTLVTTLAFLVFIGWALLALDMIVGTFFFTPTLRRDRNLSERTYPAPRVSIIFAAKNEAAHVGSALRTMLAQDYPDFEVIAVNDRSTDGTLAVLHKTAAHLRGVQRLKVIDIQNLPPGWLGKTHALYQGSLASSGRWLLFTDADVHFDPVMLQRVMHAVQDRRLDHLALFPNMTTRNYIETIFIHYFIILFNLRYQLWTARFRQSPFYVGIGAFNFFSREAYEKIGTHKKIALEVIDDMMLGLQVKRAGFRQMAMFGQELVSVRWVEGFRGVVQSLEKNAFAAFDYSVPLLLGLTAASFLLNIFPYLILFSPNSPAFFPALGSIAAIFLLYLANQKYNAAALAAFPLHPVTCLLMSFVVWRSAIKTLAAGGVRWRDTFYSIKELKAGRKAS